MKHTIDVQRSRVHNLKNVSVSLPRNAIIVFTGLSGSGKSSLAFDTIYAEGQRRYMESLSAYARQFLDQLDKPDVDHIDGLSPAISIDQKAASHNPRSTVGTITEIYDYLRLLFASIGTPFCPSCKKPIQKVSLQEIKDIIVKTSSADSAVQIMAPLVRDKKGSFADLLDQLKKDGFSRVLINNTLHKLSEPISLKKNEKHSIDLVIDRLALNQDNQSRLHQSLETALHYSDGLVRILNLETQKSTLFSEKFSCPTCMYSLQEISHRLFSFNSPLGACETCRGLGEKLDFDLAQVIEFPKNPIRSCTGKIINLDDTYYGRSVEKAAKGAGFSLDTPYNKLTEKQRNLFLYGNEEAFSEALVDRDWEEESSVRDIFGHYAHPWEGVITNLRRRYQTTQSEPMRFHMRSFMSSIPCESCQGTRLKSEALNVKIQSKTIADLCQTTILDLVPFFETLPLTEQEEKIANQVLKEIRSRLGFLKNVGLDYLTLDRRSGTLSGGEYQRIRLATQIGAGLTGVLYVLDEPSIGLHQRDNQRLIKTLQRLRDIGNTLLVVEHDEETIKAADWVVEIGPCAGNKGGNIVFSGAQNAFLKTDTLTAQYLQQKKSIPVPSTLRKIVKKKMLTLTGATENNLKNLTISFPLNTFICITGVSGSGKSTLIHDILHRALMKHFHNSKPRPGKYKSLSGLQHLDKVITIDQSPIGKTPRSNPSTYTGIFGPIRDLFAQLNEAKIRGYKPGRFSFNVKGGRCDACEGDGVKKIEMHFLSDIYVTCDVCKGKRYNQETLEVKYKGASISDVLNMTVNEAVVLFENVPQIASKLKTLQEVGLGYIHMGQNATTLSGGEAQRVKLAKELSKRSTGKTLYLLDEPTTGLHFEDIAQLLKVLHRLVDSQNTMIVIEHNLDVIKTADYIIDLGPDGGKNGGELLAQGRPEDIVKASRSSTGTYLAPLLTPQGHTKSKKRSAPPLTHST